MDLFIDYLVKNKEWLFSGVLTTAAFSLASYLWAKKRKPSRSFKVEANQLQRAQGTLNVNAGGNVHIGAGFEPAAAKQRDKDVEDIAAKDNPPVVSRPAFDITQIPPLSKSEMDKAGKFRSYDSDQPPEIKVWVGRVDELKSLRETESTVIVITGIGGQGKSSLAAVMLSQWIDDHPKLFWDWRDCREEGERFTTQLYAILARLSQDQFNAQSLSSVPFEDVCRLFFRLIRDNDGFIVFDNVDHYVDVKNERFSRGLTLFVEEALRQQSSFRIVFTCRPKISYPSLAFRHVELTGLSFPETVDLFRTRKISIRVVSDLQIEEMHRLTQGHAFWLTVLASELERKHGAANEIIEELKRGQGQPDRVVAMLRPIWKTVAVKEQRLMQVLAECSRPVSAGQLYNAVKYDIKTNNQFQRALNAVVSFSLVARKSFRGSDAVYELHPVVRQFLRTQMLFEERKPLMQRLAESLKSYVLTIQRSKGWSSLSIQTFESAAMNIETLVAAKQIEEAVKNALVVYDAFVSRGLLEEFVRIGTTILECLEQEILEESDSTSVLKFVSAMVQSYVEVGREADARLVIEKYAHALPSDTASKIRWLRTLCRCEWLLGNSDQAIAYGREGVQLKESSNLDSEADASHTLSLALRDAGHVDEALLNFSHGENLAELLSDERQRETHGGAFYGNIGRCLFLKGEIEPSIGFITTSWKLQQSDESPIGLENIGWAGLWLGEALMAKGDFKNAAIFLAFAREAWTRRLPMKLDVINKAAALLPPDLQNSGLSALELKLRCDAFVRDFLAALSPTH